MRRTGKQLKGPFMANLVVKETRLKNVVLIKPPTIFEDFRGSWVETYNKHIYMEAGVDIEFVQDDISTSFKHVLRGIHGDNKTYKLLSCLYGKLYVVIVDCGTDSKDFGTWQAFTLTDCNRLQLLVPPKYGVAHLVMSETAILGYKQSTYYDRASQFTYRWDDPRFGIYWPVKNPILSERDFEAQ